MVRVRLPGEVVRHVVRIPEVSLRPDGAYVRRWVPEVGTDEYPEPIVDLKETRNAALAAYEQVKASR